MPLSLSCISLLEVSAVVKDGSDDWGVRLVLTVVNVDTDDWEGRVVFTNAGKKDQATTKRQASGTYLETGIRLWKRNQSRIYFRRHQFRSMGAYSGCPDRIGANPKYDKRSIMRTLLNHLCRTHNGRAALARWAMILEENQTDDEILTRKLTQATYQDDVSSVSYRRHDS